MVWVLLYRFIVINDIRCKLNASSIPARLVEERSVLSDRQWNLASPGLGNGVWRGYGGGDSPNVGWAG